MKRNENMSITGIAEKLGYSAADISALAANGVIKSVPENRALYNLPDVRAAIKAHENGEEPPPPRAKKKARKSAKKAEPEMPITPVPSMPPPKPEEYDELKDAPPPTEDEEDIPDVTPQLMQAEKFKKVRWERKTAALNYHIKAGDYVSKREAAKTAEGLKNAIVKVIEGVPDLYAPAAMKAGAKTRADALRFLHSLREELTDEVLKQFIRSNKQIGIEK